MFIPITIIEIYDHEFLLVGIFHPKLFFFIDNRFYTLVSFNFSLQEGGLSKILIGTIRINLSHSVVHSEGKNAVLGCFNCYYPEICSENDHFKNIKKLTG